jgi:ATP-dependent Clp protease ATP-binding subunit ClpB
LEEQSAALTARWNEEKKSLQSVQKLKKTSTRPGRNWTSRSGAAISRAAGEIAYGVIPDLERKLKAAEGKGLRASSSTKRSPKSTLPASYRAGPEFPSTRCSKANARSCSIWSTVLENRVIGQDEAGARRLKRGAARACRLARSQPPDRLVPFLGPTGVGKTELTKALAAFLFDDDYRDGRIDMSNSWRSIRSRASSARRGLCRL